MLSTKYIVALSYTFLDQSTLEHFNSQVQTPAERNRGINLANLLGPRVWWWITLKSKNLEPGWAVGECSHRVVVKVPTTYIRYSPLGSSLGRANQQEQQPQAHWNLPSLFLCIWCFSWLPTSLTNSQFSIQFSILLQPRTCRMNYEFKHVPPLPLSHKWRTECLFV